MVGTAKKEDAVSVYWYNMRNYTGNECEAPAADMPSSEGMSVPQQSELQQEAEEVTNAAAHAAGGDSAGRAWHILLAMS